MEYEKDYKFNSTISFIFDRKILPILKGRKVLDVGCATGEYLRHFGKKSLGLDLSAKNVLEAKSLGLRVKQEDLNNPKSLDDKFEAVFMSHILEHVENPVHLLRFASDALLPNGLLVISVPNEDSLIHLRYPYFTGDGNHLYSFSEKNMDELLQYTGFDVYKHYYGYQTALSTKLGINGALSLLGAMPKMVKNKFAWEFWILARKK